MALPFNHELALMIAHFRIARKIALHHHRVTIRKLPEYAHPLPSKRPVPFDRQLRLPDNRNRGCTSFRLIFLLDLFTQIREEAPTAYKW